MTIAILVGLLALTVAFFAALDRSKIGQMRKRMEDENNG